jgi:hypothetical protein
MEYIDVLAETASEYLMYDRSLPYLSKTKLLKLTFLVEYCYFKKYQRRLSNADWVFYLYGPYLYDFEDTLKRSPFSAEEFGDDGDYKVIVKDESYFERERIDDFDVKQVIRKIVAEYGKNDLNEILDFIYFDTEPMLNVEKRCDRLDFNCIKPYQEVKHQKLEKNEIITIIEKYKKRIQNARAI